MTIRTSMPATKLCWHVGCSVLRVRQLNKAEQANVENGESRTVVSSTMASQICIWQPASLTHLRSILAVFTTRITAALFHSTVSPRVGPGYPSSPLSIYFFILSPFSIFPFFIGFTYFLLLSIPSLSTRIVPLRFQAGGGARPNLGLVCVLLCNLCYLYSVVKIDCGVLFYLV